MRFEDISFGALPQLDRNHFGFSHLEKGNITISWDNLTGVTLGEQSSLFKIKFKAKSNSILSNVLTINSAYTSAEAYTSSMDQKAVNLEYNDSREAIIVNEYQLEQNVPNPFETYTKIKFSLPKSEEATLTVYGYQGKILWQQTKLFPSGRHEITLDNNDLNHTGLMYYTLKTENFSCTKKMFLIRE